MHLNVDLSVNICESVARHCPECRILFIGSANQYDMNKAPSSGLISEDKLYELMEKSFKHKFANKPQVIEPNMQMLKRGYQEVQ